MVSIADLAGRELRWVKAWTFKRLGFLQTRATIRACGSEDEVAVFQNCWMTTFGFTTETGEPLVRFRKIGGLLSLSSAVEITPASA